MALNTRSLLKHPHIARRLPTSSVFRCGSAAALIAALSSAASVSAATLPASFSETQITGVITNATAFEFAPDGKLFVLEQAGTLEVYQGSGSGMWTQLSANFFLNAPLVVDSMGERGLLGIAFDPNYATNRFVYIYYTATSPAVHNRIARYTANAAGTLALAGSAATILDLDNLSGATNHNGGAIHFGPDGKLYAAVGENANSANSQVLTNKLGKMLRLNPDPANPIPGDNPTSIAGITGSPTGTNKAIWAAGLRNPFTFAFHPNTGVMYINDVGQGLWEEVNVGSAAANYGWSATEGPFNQASFPSFTNPIVAYQHSGGGQNKPPGNSYTGFAITGGAFYVTPNPIYPSTYIGDYFFADVVSNWIRRFDPVNNVVHNFATNAPGVVDLHVGPDGALYYLARNSQRVFRVTYSGPLCSTDVAPIGAPNGTVDVDDLLAVINSWGPCDDPANCPADTAPAGGNNEVDVDDLLALINSWGPCN